MTLKSRAPQNKVDPIAYAWKATYGSDLPPSLRQTDCERAGHANAIMARRKGKHTLSVCA